MASPKLAPARSLAMNRTRGSRVRFPASITRLSCSAMSVLGHRRGEGRGGSGGSGLRALRLDELELLARARDDQLTQDRAAEQGAALDLVDGPGGRAEV